MEDNNNKEYSVKHANIDGKEIWTVYNEECPWRIGQGETEEEAVKDYLASENFIESEENYDFPSEETKEEIEEEKKSKRKSAIIWIVSLAVILAAIVGSIIYLMPKVIGECIDAAVYNDLDDMTKITYAPGETIPPVISAGSDVTIVHPGSTPSSSGDITFPIVDPFGDAVPTEEPTPTPPPEKLYTKYKRDFDKLKSINKDCVGWLEIPDTKISYPVVYTPNPDKYLDTGFDGKPNRYGTIYVTGQVGMSGQNITMYGHASTYYESMFSTLKKYKDQKYYNNHKEIFFTNTSGVTTKYTIFAVIIVSVEGKTFNYRQANFLNDTDLQQFVSTAKSLNIIKINEDVPAGSKLITLSTCMKGDKRFVVIGHS